MARQREVEADDPFNRQLSQLLALAQLSKVYQEPELERQRLSQEDARARLRSAVDVLGLQTQQQTAGEQLAEQARYHTGELETRSREAGTQEKAQQALERYQTGQLEHAGEETASQERTRMATIKGSLQESLAGHILATQPTIGLSTVAGALRRGGQPELADTLDEAHQVDLNKKVAVAAQSLSKLQPKERTKQIETIKNDPELFGALKPHIDALYGPTAAPTPTPTTAPILTGGSPLETLLNLRKPTGYEPQLPPYGGIH